MYALKKELVSLHRRWRCPFILPHRSAFFSQDRRVLEVRRCCCWLGKRLRTVNGTTVKRKKMKNTLEVIIKQATRCVRAGCMRAVLALQECRARIRDRFFFFCSCALPSPFRPCLALWGALSPFFRFLEYRRGQIRMLVHDHCFGWQTSAPNGDTWLGREEM